jgi:hypothetical protein
MNQFKNLYEVEAFLKNNKGGREGEALKDIWNIIVEEGIGEERSVVMFEKFYKLMHQLLN